jgi:hypothetical protein
MQSVPPFISHILFLTDCQNCVTAQEATRPRDTGFGDMPADTLVNLPV